MAVHVITGKLGAGKTLVAIGRIQDYLTRGRIVATNLDLRLYNFPRVGRYAKKTRVIRVPDKPSLDDFNSIGRGNHSYNENENGLLVLDECGTWFNSRNWADKTRQPVIDWCLHARKLGWDIIFIIQDISLMDKQAREALAEHVVYCRRMDKLNIPVIGSFFSLFANSRLPLPKIHFGIVKYGDLPQSLTVDKWVYTGRDLYSSYDTKQIFTANYFSGSYCLIPPYYTHGQFSIKKDFKFYRIYLKKTNRLFMIFSFLALGAAIGFFLSSNKPSEAINTPQQIKREGQSSISLPRLTINSFSQMGNDVFINFIDSKSTIYYSFDLIKEGYKVEVKDACHVILSQKNYIQHVSC
ncbi:zonular occludens toxin domain-containing protein [Pectobacterium carotovorum]|uniref:Zona occludens toxin N-terminal domain-containing protein n=1 Tax=Pectobacterium carotovorum TaxID=554 RepID=A0A419AUL4_PECCA|nr:zonular occludens toxin domain-containing protein [Pectobacterium carotovorum]RJL50482.1 hypothetical protein D5071_12925 [Pectobacterium carotovorum]